MDVAKAGSLDLIDRCKRSRGAARALAAVGREPKDLALGAIARRLREAAKGGAGLLEANGEDIAAARASGLSTAMVDRLRLDPGRLQSMADAVLEVAALDDPVGEVIGM